VHLRPEWDNKAPGPWDMDQLMHMLCTSGAGTLDGCPVLNLASNCFQVFCYTLSYARGDGDSTQRTVHSVPRQLSSIIIPLTVTCISLHADHCSSQ
jgi:hypothetical protein